MDQTIQALGDSLDAMIAEEGLSQDVRVIRDAFDIFAEAGSRVMPGKGIRPPSAL
ncbi:MAG TPA: hypothetical protein VMW89_17790 [Desulfatiglandales bacterium]|nr:hypothetical protein [Desulfatiglandales bacterium]